MKIALIACTKSKMPYSCPAKELYSKSDLFRKEYIFAKTLADNIYILSAKHGLVSEDTILAPYDQTLCGAKTQIKKDWSKKVLKQMEDTFDMQNDEFIFLADQDYIKYLIAFIKEKYNAKIETPLENIGAIGKIKQYLKQFEDEEEKE